MAVICEIAQATHPLEIKVGAIILPKVLVQSIMKSLPKGALRDHRACTPYKDVKQCLRGVSSEMAALHLSHAAIVALEEGQSLETVLGKLVANHLQAADLSWAMGLRALAKSCRSDEEHRVFDEWHQEVLSDAHCTTSRSDSYTFRFVELFAGIGGFRLGLEPLGGSCAFAVELDEGARAVYKANFGHECVSDVVAVDVADIPPCDILTAGFPCQPFAFCNTDNVKISGRLDSGPGLREAKRGALGLEVVRILRATRPKAFILENVPNLKSFNAGADLAALEDALRRVGYIVHTTILDAHHFGLPQQRRRLYLVGLRSDLSADALAAFQWPIPERPGETSLRSILEPPNQIPQDCLISEEAWANMRKRDAKAVLPSGRGGRIARLDGYARTLTSSYRRNGATYSELLPRELTCREREANPQEPQESENVLKAAESHGCVDEESFCDQSNDALPETRRTQVRPALPAWLPGQPPPRFFTKKECCRLQGFPEDFVMEVSHRKCKDPGRFYHFVGNAVAPPVIQAIGVVVVKVLKVASQGTKASVACDEQS